MPTIIENVQFKEIYCKNDDCRKLLGYEYVKKGLLAFKCPNCHHTSVFAINSSKLEAGVDKLMMRFKTTMKGGEKENGE